MIQKLIENKQPFAIIQYFNKMIGLDDHYSRVYELIYLDKKDELRFKIIPNKVSIEAVSKLKKVLENEHGAVWEFNNFKEYRNIILESKS